MKPDQLLKRRGKLGLVKVGVALDGVKEWVGARMGEEIQVGAAHGKLSNFIVEPFVPHQQKEEFYVRWVSSSGFVKLLFSSLLLPSLCATLHPTCKCVPTCKCSTILFRQWTQPFWNSIMQVDMCTCVSIRLVA